MMKLDYLRGLYDYNWVLHRRILDSAGKLSPEQFMQPHPYSIGSLHRQLVHTMATEKLWLRRIRGDVYAVFDTPEQHPDLDSIRRHWTEIEAEWRKLLNGLTEAELERPIRYRSVTDHTEHETPLWVVLFHVVNHGTDHRAQILALIFSLGGETFPQDLLFYSWEHIDKALVQR